VSFPRRRESRVFLVCRKIKNLNPVYPVNLVQNLKMTITNPIFSRPNMHYQYQKRRNGGQKTTQKNETNPIMDNFRVAHFPRRRREGVALSA
jgi:hypothetical protein